MLQECFQRDEIEAGCDEAGRGCLAGPVVAAAVILPEGFHHPLLNDSKQMTRKNRETLREIIEREAVCWAVRDVSPQRIDQINILNASFEAMTDAVRALNVPPGFLLIDGNRFRSNLEVPFQCVVGGDAIYASVAAASVLAKTHRDEYMTRLAGEFPGYGWERNMGYPTREHRLAVERLGITPHHRTTFGQNPNQLRLF